MLSVISLAREGIFVVYRFFYKIILSPGWGGIFIAKRTPKQPLSKSRMDGTATDMYHTCPPLGGSQPNLYTMPYVTNNYNS